MKFKMNGIKYEIKEMQQKEYKEYRIQEDKEKASEITDTSKGVWHGATHFTTDFIFIDKNLPEDRKRRVLLHELTHCYIGEYVSHQENQYTEEDVADIAANSHDIVHNIVEKYFNEDKM